MGTPTRKLLSNRRPTFTIACGLFACIAFAQLMAVGVAIAVRTGETREVVRYVKGDPLIVSVPTIRDTYPKGKSVQARSVEQLLAAYTDESDLPSPPSVSPSFEPAPMITATPETAPSIANPRVETLVAEAHSAHQQGDMIAALVKLDEAESIQANEPAIFYRKALLFEDMGQWERATNNYEKLFVLGPAIGVYYHKAAYKLSNGINPESNNQNLFVIGHIMRRISPDKLSARLTIPIRCSPDGDFDATQLEVKVHHYDLVDNQSVEAVPPSRAENISDRWISPHPDWMNEEEIAESIYTLPAVSEADAHLFGDRKYFGYVAELYYKNELIDQQAYPRRLHAIHAEKNSSPEYGLPYDFPMDQALPNINPDNPLLPALPRH
jgi:tetratricopeptide (TPR) repeat protein